MCLHHHTGGHPIADEFTSRVGVLRGAAPRTWACSDTWRDCMHWSRRVSSVELATGNFHSVAELAQFCREALAVVALQLDYAVLHGAARPAESLERLRDALYQCGVVWQARHDCYDLPPRPLRSRARRTTPSRGMPGRAPAPECSGSAAQRHAPSGWPQRLQLRTRPIPVR